MRACAGLEQKDQSMKIRPPLPVLAGVLSVSLNVAQAATIADNFAANPLAAGWSVHGNTNLFSWNVANQNLDVAWDSSQPNSYFCRALSTNLNKATDFMLSFDLRLSDIGPGVDTNKPFTFQIAVGLLNLAHATNAGFIRGSGYQAPNLVEFNYFWDSGFGATVSPVLISSNSEYNDGGFTFPLELTTNTTFRVTMLYTAADRTLRTTMTSNGAPFGPVKDATLGGNFSDFTVDHFGVSSYSDAGQYPGFEGSVLAHGVLDNFVFATPPPVTKLMAVPDAGPATVQFQGSTNWLYLLERTTDFQSWAAASASTPGTSSVMLLQDTNPPSAGASYRVRAQLP